ncbi:hypothetical protein LUZ60_006345 [Juncus effusus]|nr:hypothetical protein LUZ60_006345 [Juncus effusus]
MAVSVTFEYFLLDQNGRPNTSGRTLKASHIFQVCYESFGSENFIDDDTLRSFYINTEGCFVLACTIQMDDESCKGVPKNPSIDFSQFDMHKDFMNILEKEEMSDVTFEVEEETFAVHKLLLAARSPVFKAELFGSISESVSNMKSIMIKDMHPDVFKSLLHFIYTDSIPKIDDKKAATVMAQHLLVAADRYAVEKLKLVCQDKLCEEISLDTVACLLALAHQHNCIELKSACLKFVAVPMNRSDLALNEEYLKLISGSPSLLAEIRAKVA